MFAVLPAAGELRREGWAVVRGLPAASDGGSEQMSGPKLDWEDDDKLWF